LSENGHKKIKIFLPRIFTILNLFFGFLAIYFALNNNTEIAIRLVILGALADFIDGRISRFLKISNPIGKEIDSLADTVSFGVAPSFIFVKNFKVLYSNSYLALIFGFLILFAVVYRLARFNLYGDSLEYTGLSSPTASMSTLPLYIYLQDTSALKFVPFIQLFTAFLMVSHIPYPSLKYTKIYNRFVFPFVIIAIVSSLIFKDWLIFFFILGVVYALLGPFLKDKVTPILDIEIKDNKRLN